MGPAAFERIEAGYLVVMHVGVLYAMAGSSGGVLVVGGHHNGLDWDNIREVHLNEKARRVAVKGRYDAFPIPDRGPITGNPFQQWIDGPSSVDAGLNELGDNLGPHCAEPRLQLPGLCIPLHTVNV